MAGQINKLHKITTINQSKLNKCSKYVLLYRLSMYNLLICKESNDELKSGGDCFGLLHSAIPCKGAILFIL